MSSWIPKDVEDEWNFSCNSKEWTSNIHGEQWVEKCFDESTQESQMENIVFSSVMDMTVISRRSLFATASTTRSFCICFHRMHPMYVNP
jgi:hypothetical protein